MLTELNHASSSMGGTTRALLSRPARNIAGNGFGQETAQHIQSVGLPEPAPTYSNGPKVPPPSAEISQSSVPDEEGPRSANRPVLEDPHSKHRFRVEDIWV